MVSRQQSIRRGPGPSTSGHEKVKRPSRSSSASHSPQSIIKVKVKHGGVDLSSEYWDDGNGKEEQKRSSEYEILQTVSAPPSKNVPVTSSLGANKSIASAPPRMIQLPRPPSGTNLGSHNEPRKKRTRRVWTNLPRPPSLTNIGEAKKSVKEETSKKDGEKVTSVALSPKKGREKVVVPMKSKRRRPSWSNLPKPPSLTNVVLPSEIIEEKAGVKLEGGRKARRRRNWDGVELPRPPSKTDLNDQERAVLAMEKVEDRPGAIVEDTTENELGDTLHVANISQKDEDQVIPQGHLRVSDEAAIGAAGESETMSVVNEAEEIFEEEEIDEELDVQEDSDDGIEEVLEDSDADYIGETASEDLNDSVDDEVDIDKTASEGLLQQNDDEDVFFEDDDESSIVEEALSEDLPLADVEGEVSRSQTNSSVQEFDNEKDEISTILASGEKQVTSTDDESRPAASSSEDPPSVLQSSSPPDNTTKEKVISPQDVSDGQDGEDNQRVLSCDMLSIDETPPGTPDEAEKSSGQTDAASSIERFRATSTKKTNSSLNRTPTNQNTSALRPRGTRKQSSKRFFQKSREQIENQRRKKKAKERRGWKQSRLDRIAKRRKKKDARKRAQGNMASEDKPQKKETEVPIETVSERTAGALEESTKSLDHSSDLDHTTEHSIHTLDSAEIELYGDEDDKIAVEERRQMREEHERNLEEIEEEDRNRRALNFQEVSNTLEGKLHFQPAKSYTEVEELFAPKRTEEKGDVHEIKIGVVPKSLQAMIALAATELRPVPEEHKVAYKPVTAEAAEIGQFTRLRESVVEAMGTYVEPTEEEKSSDRKWTKGKATVELPKQSNRKIEPFMVLQEAAAVGRMKRLKADVTKNYDEKLDTEVEQRIDVDDIMDERVGGKDFRIKYLTEFYVQDHQKEKQKDFDDEDDEVEDVKYASLDEVPLPSEKLPVYKPVTKSMTRAEMMEDISRSVAEKSWERRYRLDRPGAKQRFRPACSCKYCQSPNAFQTAAYRKKWLVEKGLWYEPEPKPEPEPELQPAPEAHMLDDVSPNAGSGSEGDDSGHDENGEFGEDIAEDPLSARRVVGDNLEEDEAMTPRTEVLAEITETTPNAEVADEDQHKEADQKEADTTVTTPISPLNVLGPATNGGKRRQSVFSKIARSFKSKSTKPPAKGLAAQSDHVRYRAVPEAIEEDKGIGSDTNAMTREERRARRKARKAAKKGSKPRRWKSVDGL